MKHLKQNEEIQKRPQIGDYVVMKKSESSLQLDKYVGRIIKLPKSKILYYIKFEDLPKDMIAYIKKIEPELPHSTISAIISEIDYFSPDKEHIESIMTGGKFNL